MFIAGLKLTRLSMDVVTTGQTIEWLCSALVNQRTITSETSILLQELWRKRNYAKTLYGREIVIGSKDNKHLHVIQIVPIEEFQKGDFLRRGHLCSQLISVGVPIDLLSVKFGYAVSTLQRWVRMVEIIPDEHHQDLLDLGLTQRQIHIFSRIPGKKMSAGVCRLKRAYQTGEDVGAVLSQITRKK